MSEIADYTGNVSREERKHWRRKRLCYVVGGTRGMVVKPVPLGLLSPAAQVLVAAQSRPVTRNSRCPCGSGRRFKRCCGASTGASVEGRVGAGREEA